MKNLMERFYAQEELTAEERKEIHAGDYRINRAKHLKCGDVITSKNRHDFVTCKCGGFIVDGGSWYLKGCGDLENYEDLS